MFVCTLSCNICLNSGSSITKSCCALKGEKSVHREIRPTWQDGKLFLELRANFGCTQGTILPLQDVIWRERDGDMFIRCLRTQCVTLTLTVITVKLVG